MIDSITKPWACNGLSAVKTFMGFISYKEALFNLVLVTILHNSELSYVFGRHKGHTTPALLRSEGYKIVLSNTIISFRYSFYTHYMFHYYSQYLCQYIRIYFNYYSYTQISQCQLLTSIMLITKLVMLQLKLKIYYNLILVF